MRAGDAIGEAQGLMNLAGCLTGGRSDVRAGAGGCRWWVSGTALPRMLNILDVWDGAWYLLRMYAAHELSQAVRTRRREIGLSQKALARMAGLSRTTVIQVEGGTIKDLSLTRTAAILEVLGLGLTISPAHPRLHPVASRVKPLELAARTASVSYARPLTTDALGQALVSGEVELPYEPHVATLLEEAPVSLLANAVEQIHTDFGVSRETVWANMRHLAMRFKTVRELWNAES